MNDFFKVNNTSFVDSDNILYVRTITADTLSFTGGGIGSAATAGYAAGGNQYGPPFQGPTALAAIQKVTFSNDATSTDLSYPAVPSPSTPNRRMSAGGISSFTDGYAVGGYTHPAGYQTSAMKFPFASASQSYITGVMVTPRGQGGAAQSITAGYNFGGFPNQSRGLIDKFPFSTDTGSAVGSINHPSPPGLGLYQVKGLSSHTHGYICGGITHPFGYNALLLKFPFSSDNSAAVSGASLAVGAEGVCAVPNSEIGYAAGGSTAPNSITGLTDTIQQFNMITEANAVDTGDLDYTRRDGAAASSATHGYVIGGSGIGGWPSNNEGLIMVDKFPFASGGNGTDIGDLPTTQGNASGAQG